MCIDVITLKQKNSSQLIAGYSSVAIPLFHRNVTLSCDSPNATWLIELKDNSTTLINSLEDGKQRINDTTIGLVGGVITIGTFGLYETGNYTCDPGSTRQATVYLQSSG